MTDLIERLRAVQWEEADDCGRMPDDPTHECVFVDMRPDDFRALLREAAAALEAAREDAERYRWLRRDAVFAGWSMPRQPIPCPDRIAGCMVAHSSWELSGATLDAAIDRAREERDALAHGGE